MGSSRARRGVSLPGEMVGVRLTSCRWSLRRRQKMLKLAELVERIRAYHPAADVEIVSRAYDFSVRAHEGQKRKSGDPYFIHPAAVAGIITELRLDTASICANLLHDVVEDTLRTLDDVEHEFGDEVAFQVDGVTKLSKINFTSKEDRQAENFRKM